MNSYRNCVILNSFWIEDALIDLRHLITISYQKHLGQIQLVEIAIHSFLNPTQEEENIRFNNPQKGNTTIDIINLYSQSLFVIEKKL